MKIKFKDVAKYYIGCKIQTSEGIGTFNVFYTPGVIKPEDAIPIGSYDLVKSEFNFDEVKPILKPLNALTEKDAIILGWADIYNLREKLHNDPNLDDYSPNEFHYLVSNGYDMFQLIDNREAIQELKEVPCNNCQGCGCPTCGGSGYLMY